MNPHDTIPIVPVPPHAPALAPDVRALVAYLEQDPQPTIVVDPDYRILAANGAYRRQFGVAGVEHVGRHCFQVSHHYDVPCDQAGEHCPMKRAKALRGLDRVLHIHHTPRGPEHVDVELRPIFDAGGDVIAYVERLTTVRSASAQPSAEGLVGSAESFNAALGALQRVAPSTLPVLLLGESGTGKELFARALHEASDRAMGPFVVVDCSGIAETLFESELFGYEKGAFTGANQRKPGLVETAQGGTLFLDEIETMPIPLQIKMLRVLQERVVERLGANELIPVDCRVIAASKADLAELAADGRFRADLLYRLNVAQIELPPLRERREDVPLLFEHFVLAAARRFGQPAPVVSAAQVSELMTHAWPGNVRELQNVADRFVLGLTGDSLLSAGGTGAAGSTLAEQLAYFERMLIEDMLRRHHGNVADASEALGMPKKTLYHKLRHLRIPARGDGE